jgi:hypothetical protein
VPTPSNFALIVNHSSRTSGTNGRSALGPAPEDSTGRAYNEDAFRHLLMIERTRNERSGGCFLLLLVDVEDGAGAAAPLNPKVASVLFDALHSSVRETDFVGWYREGAEIGAVLPQSGEMIGVDLQRTVYMLIDSKLQKRVPKKVAASMRLRLSRVPD